MDALFKTRQPRVEVSVDDERTRIRDGQKGDRDAQWLLLIQYAPLLQVTANRVRGKVHKMTTEQIEDLESELVLAALQTIQDFDPDKYIRLSQVLPNRLKDVASRWETALDIPSTTLGRWFKIWREAGMDITEGAKLAPERGMTANTFRSIHLALETTSSEWTTVPYNAARVVPDTETHRLAHQALAVLTPSEREAVEYLYGFRGDPKSYAEIADLTESPRATVQSRVERALAKMRASVE